MAEKKNRFSELISWCPRCGNTVTVRKFIVNTTKDSNIVTATYACPVCFDVVQVFIEGESFDNVHRAVPPKVDTL